jgi:hypothetical protein
MQTLNSKLNMKELWNNTFIDQSEPFSFAQWLIILAKIVVYVPIFVFALLLCSFILFILFLRIYVFSFLFKDNEWL